MGKAELSACFHKQFVTTKKVKDNTLKNEVLSLLPNLHSRSWVSVHKVAKANNYDLVKTSMDNCRLQRKYNTTNFSSISVYEQAKKDLEKLSIFELTNLIDKDNEVFIMKLVEKKIKDIEHQEYLAKKQEKKLLKQKAIDVASKKATKRMRYNYDSQQLKVMFGNA